MSHLRMPELSTDRLVVREFRLEDAAARQHIMQEAFGDTIPAEANQTWMQWTVLGYGEFAALYQPPYGERALALRGTDDVIGIVGLVPAVVPWGVFPAYRPADEAHHTLLSAEFGLFWAVGTAHQKQGYATEGAHALITYLFNTLGVRRMIATTEFDNHASQQVMTKLGMTLLHNTSGEPPWCQVVGLMQNPALS